MSANDDYRNASIVDINIHSASMLDKASRLCVDCFPGYRYSEFCNVFQRNSYISKGAFYGAELVGLLLAKMENRSESKLTPLLPANMQLEADFDVSNISYLCVKQEFRRFGIGRKLVNSIIEHCMIDDKIKYIYLHTSVMNKVGLKFYDRLNFKIINRIKNYYTGQRAGNDAHVLTLTLEDLKPNLVEDKATTTNEKQNDTTINSGSSSRRRNRSCGISIQYDFKINYYH